MISRCVSLMVVAAGLTTVVNARAADAGGVSDAKAAATAHRFFVYVNVPPTEVLQKLGYDVVPSIYLNVQLGKSVPDTANIKKQLKAFEGKKGVFWLTIRGGDRKNTDEWDRQVVEVFRDLAAEAEKVGVPIAIYPHMGDYILTVRDALRVVKKIDRPNVGISLNLCHELAAGNRDELLKIIDEIAPHLRVVTINGADNDGKPWKTLIMPLGTGSYDVLALLKKLKAVGFRGPIGLQTFGLEKPDPKSAEPPEHLKQSIAAWREYQRKLAAE